MNDPLLDKVLLMILLAPVMVFAMDGSSDNEQALYHVWTPEPKLLTAISCQDRDFGCAHPDDPNRHETVPLPTVVRTAICDLTRRTFEQRLYDGPERYADLFGPIYHLAIPDRNDLHLYVYRLNEIPSLSPRWFSIVLVLYDAEKKLATSAPVKVDTDYQPYCPRPWIRLRDILGDPAVEILVFTGHHLGTDAHHILQHVLSIEPDLTVREVLTLGTGIFIPHAFPPDTLVERGGYAVRTVQKVSPVRVEVAVTLSKTKLDQGTHILGFETWEMQEDGRMHKTAQKVITDRKFRHIFQAWQ